MFSAIETISRISDNRYLEILILDRASNHISIRCTLYPLDDTLLRENDRDDVWSVNLA